MVQVAAGALFGLLWLGASAADAAILNRVHSGTVSVVSSGSSSTTVGLELADATKAFVVNSKQSACEALVVRDTTTSNWTPSDGTSYTPGSQPAGGPASMLTVFVGATGTTTPALQSFSDPYIPLLTAPRTTIGSLRSSTARPTTSTTPGGRRPSAGSA